MEENQIDERSGIKDIRSTHNCSKVLPFNCMLFCSVVLCIVTRLFMIAFNSVKFLPFFEQLLGILIRNVTYFLRGLMCIKLPSGIRLCSAVAKLQFFVRQPSDYQYFSFKRRKDEYVKFVNSESYFNSCVDSCLGI